MGRRRRITRFAAAAVAILVAGLMAPVAPSVSAAPAAGGYLPTGGPYQLINVNSGKCLEVGFGGKADFNAVNQYTCHRGTPQQWSIWLVL